MAPGKPRAVCLARPGGEGQAHPVLCGYLNEGHAGLKTTGPPRASPRFAANAAARDRTQDGLPGDGRQREPHALGLAPAPAPPGTSVSKQACLNECLSLTGEPGLCDFRSAHYRVYDQTVELRKDAPSRGERVRREYLPAGLPARIMLIGNQAASSYTCRGLIYFSLVPP